MKVTNDRMGVYVLMSHLVITLSLVIVYAIFKLKGIDDETVSFALVTIVGYWFGKYGDQLTKKKQDVGTIEGATTIEK